MRGTVTKKNNRWYYVVYTGKDENGKWKQEWSSGFKTKREAERALRLKVEEIESSFERAQSLSTMATYLHHWLDTYCATRLAPNTINGYRVNIEKHIIPHIGSIPMNRLKPDEVQAMYEKLTKKGLSPTSIRYVHNTLHRALGVAVKRQLVRANAADFVEAPVVAHFEAKTLSPAQVQALLQAAQTTEVFIPILFAVLLGLRRGEALGLCWGDVDFTYNTITIRHSAYFDKGALILGDTKTKNSRRTLMLSQGLLEALKRHQAQQVEWSTAFGPGYNPQGLVCCRACGSPITPNVLQHQYKTVLQENDLPAIRFHDLRHTNATLLLRNQIPAKIVSSMLGHSNIGITLDIYSHVMTDMQSTAVGVMDELLKPVIPAENSPLNDLC